MLASWREVSMSLADRLTRERLYLNFDLQARHVNLDLMSKAAVLNNADEHYKAQARSYLAEAQRILRQLAVERRREERRDTEPQILREVKAILQTR